MRFKVLFRLRTVVAALWLGVVFTLAAIVAPAAFALFDRPMAGQFAGRLFLIEGYAGLGFSLALILIERALAGRSAEGGTSRGMTPELTLVLGALFCTVLGEFGLRPMMEAARTGQGAIGFGAVHGVASALFGLKGLLLLTLVWRSSGPAAVSLPPRRAG